MKIWLDDARPAPEGWAWARNVAQAKALFEAADRVDECSLDHDLGLDVAVDAGVDIEDMEALLDWVDSVDEVPNQTGMELVDWMIETNHIPNTITIHSWNAPGALRMARRFYDHGIHCTLLPFRVSP